MHGTENMQRILVEKPKRAHHFKEQGADGGHY
jgi:hypothetical protein